MLFLLPRNLAAALPPAPSAPAAVLVVAGTNRGEALPATAGGL